MKKIISSVGSYRVDEQKSVRGDALIRKADINLSGIFSALIVRAAQMTEAYQSDILFDIDKIKSLIALGQSFDYRLGFRQLGIDGETEINQRELWDAKTIYRSRYLVRCEVEAPDGRRDWTPCTIEVSLFDVDGEEVVRA